jgi:glycosyltransferase involved in cell wall biosynthesis
MIDLAVIIPCFNEAGSLPHQLDALAEQHWDGTWEVIVVDNGSTDGTADVARSHPGLADRLRVVEAHDGHNIAYARRAGVEASAARAVAFCDGDDVVAPGWLAALGDALRDHEIVTGEIDVSRLNTPALARSRGDRARGAPPLFGEVLFARGNNHGMWRSVWDELGGFDEQFGGLEDIELSLRAHAAGHRVHLAPDAVVHYRYRAGLLALWRQARYYGRSHALNAARCVELGLQPPSRWSGLRSWAWLAVNVVRLHRPEIRYRWWWTLGSRVGVISGALKARTLRI